MTQIVLRYKRHLHTTQISRRTLHLIALKRISIAISAIFVAALASSFTNTSMAGPWQQPTTFRDGTCVVNQQFAPQTYRAMSKGNGCYCAQLYLVGVDIAPAYSALLAKAAMAVGT